MFSCDPLLQFPYRCFKQPSSYFSDRFLSRFRDGERTLDKMAPDRGPHPDRLGLGPRPWIPGRPLCDELGPQHSREVQRGAQLCARATAVPGHRVWAVSRLLVWRQLLDCLVWRVCRPCGQHTIRGH